MDAGYAVICPSASTTVRCVLDSTTAAPNLGGKENRSSSDRLIVASSHLSASTASYPCTYFSSRARAAGRSRMAGGVWKCSKPWETQRLLTPPDVMSGSTEK